MVSSLGLNARKLFNEPAKFRHVDAIVTWKGEWEEYTFLDSLFEEKIVIWRKIIDERLRVLLEEEKGREERQEENDSSEKIRISESCKQDLTICAGCGRWTGANVARVSSLLCPPFSPTVHRTAIFRLLHPNEE